MQAKFKEQVDIKPLIEKELYVNDDGCSCVVKTLSRVVTTRSMCPKGCRVVKMKEVR